jgi:hypothetical protein
MDLYKNIKNCTPEQCNYSTFLDFYGTENINNNENMNIITGIYSDIIKFYAKDSILLLYKLFVFNKLDEFINKWYSIESGYFNDFIKNKIKIGKTALLSNFNTNYDLVDDNNKIIFDKFEILSNDYCPCCNTNGFFTKKFALMNHSCCPECITCDKYGCIKCCIIIDKNQPYLRECLNCNSFNQQSNKNNIKDNISKKLNSHKQSDIIKFGKHGNLKSEDVEKLLIKQLFKCYVCDDMVITTNYKPYCCYQFSIDRIDNNKPHDKNNVLISCYYCNCRNFPLFDQLNKICNSGCHTIKREIKTTRENIEK